MESKLENGLSYNSLIVYGVSSLGLGLIVAGLVIPGRPVAALGVALCVFAATRSVLARLSRLESSNRAAFELGQEVARLKRV